MAIEYGFFNSVGGDRLYNADDINTFLEGLISSSGIFANVGNMFQVTPSSGMTLNVGAGKGMINLHWCRSAAAVNVTLAASHVTLNRYDAIVLRLDVTNRMISLVVIKGTNASSPTKPSIIRNSLYYDICLAYVYVGARVTSISQSNIQDTRLNSSLCGLITGLIQQLDTTQFLAQLDTWKNEQQAAFESWYTNLTEELNVDTYIEQYHKFVQLAYSDSKIVKLDMTGYTYSPTDVIFISLNGLTATETQDYLLDTSKNPVQVHLNFVGSQNQVEDVDIKILKSKIGYATLTDSEGNAIVTSSGANIRL